MQKNKSTSLLLGAHMSIAKGFDKAVYDTISIGGNSLQIFTKSNRQWKARALTEKEIDAFQKALSECSIQAEHVFVHASYLINCATDNNELRKKATLALVEEIHRCALLGIPYLVLHPGTAKNSKEESFKLLAHSLDEALKQTDDSVTILLENMAGQGASIGSTFAELAEIKKHIHHKKRIKFCLDTCHAFVAGYDMREKHGYQQMLAEIEKTIGIENIRLIHLNDSKKTLGSHVDRHEHITKGLLGTKFFENICLDKHFLNVPKILETPKTSLLDHQQDIERVKSLLQ